jgi:hypothetical protein
MIEKRLDQLLMVNRWKRSDVLIDLYIPILHVVHSKIIEIFRRKWKKKAVHTAG